MFQLLVFFKKLLLLRKAEHFLRGVYQIKDGAGCYSSFVSTLVSLKITQLHLRAESF